MGMFVGSGCAVLALAVGLHGAAVAQAARRATTDPGIQSGGDTPMPAQWMSIMRRHVAAGYAGAIDTTHPERTGGPGANNLGLTPGTVDCPTSTQPSTSVLCIRAATGATPRQNYVVNINLDSYAGATRDPVALYAGVRVHPGAPQSWAFNTVTHLEAGAEGGIGYELDLNNWNCDAGDNNHGRAPGCTMQTPVGLLLTGSSPFPAGPAIAISGANPARAQWHRGIEMLGGAIIDQASIYTDNGAATDYVMRGVHVVGLDASAGTFTGAVLLMSPGQNLLWAGPDGATHNLLVDASGFHFAGPGGATTTIDNNGTVVAGGNVTLRDGQLVCWQSADGACVTYQQATGRFLFSTTAPGNAYHAVAALDGRTGDLTLRGRLIQDTPP